MIVPVEPVQDLFCCYFPLCLSQDSINNNNTTNTNFSENNKPIVVHIVKNVLRIF